MRRRFHSRICFVVAALILVTAVNCVAQSSNRAVTAFEQHDFAEARPIFEAMVATNSANFDAKVYLGRIALEEGRLDDGVQLLEQASSGWGTNASAFLWLGRAYGLQARATGAPTGAGPARRAKAAFEKAISLDPDLIDGREGLVKFYREAPRIIGGGRKPALAEVEQIKKRDLYSGLLIHGDILMDARKYSEARRVYEQALEKKPEHVDAWYRLGILFIETKEFQKAFEAFDKILSMKADEQSVHYYIGKTCALSGQQLKRGEESLETYLKTKPWYIMPPLSAAHLHLATIYERQGRTDEARAEYQSVLKLNPACSGAKDRLRRLSR